MLIWSPALALPFALQNLSLFRKTLCFLSLTFFPLLSPIAPLQPKWSTLFIPTSVLCSYYFSHLEGLASPRDLSHTHSLSSTSFRKPALTTLGHCFLFFPLSGHSHSQSCLWCCLGSFYIHELRSQMYLSQCITILLHFPFWLKPLSPPFLLPLFHWHRGLIIPREDRRN